MGKKNWYKEYVEDDVFVTDKGKPYLSYITEDEGNFDFVCITGKGMKINKKNKYLSYKVSLEIPESEAIRIRGIAQALWDEFKPKGADDEPANDLVYENDDGLFFINPHARVENAEGEPTEIGIVNSVPKKLDPAVFGSIGKGSTGHVNVNFTTYDEGVSMYLNGIQLINYTAYVGGKGDGTSGFTAKKGQDLGDGKTFSKKEKKDKKKKKKSKK